MHNNTHQPIEQRHIRLMNELAKTIDEIFNHGLPEREIGFSLFIFPINGNDGRMNYISTAERKSMITALRKFCDNHEHQPLTTTIQ